MILGLKETVLRVAVRDLRDQDVSLAEATELFARAAWTMVAEPGDGTAGALVAALGPAGALAAVLEGRSPVRLATEAGAAGPDAPEVPELSAALERWQPRLLAAGVLHALKSAAVLGVRLVAPGDEEWPTGLGDLGRHAPTALWCRGNPSVLGSPLPIALVGARAATGYGEHVAAEAASGLVDRGFSIVSGAAYGIDGMAHRAALASGGTTIAYLAGGVDRFYPSGHDALLRRIVDSGAVVSELPCGASPTKWRFLQRNRLIAAASRATVVIEAGTRSGSLNTAGHAAALARPLGAVPGPVTSSASAGCHRLLREFDAVCVTDAAEMAELVVPTVAGAPTEAGPRLPAEAGRVLDALSTRGRPVDDVARSAGLSVASVRSALGLLELEALARETATGWRRA
ncbi:MAG: processing protein DprA [Naasia sp.]|jgi:DNA processing protein|uniref:DNA-processing protein DprA n=1 Tax=Naasia sp. TaxID=2546198 RepID=UPI002629F96C|nr:DNA-processing protein DprA [Naasia sp.]MCU1571155.1 processing protein DprA [Naasia sp.]